MLHSRPYRDSSVLVDLLSEEHGHVSAIAYVGKGKKSNKKGLLQPFSCLDVELKGQHDLKTLSQVQQAQKSLPLSGHHLFSGFYMNELMVRLLPENIPCEMLFYLYQTSIQALNEQQEIEPILRRFEMRLLEELGLSLDFSVLEHDPSCLANMIEDVEHGDYEHPNIATINGKWQFIPQYGFVAAQIGVNYPHYDQDDLQKIANDDLTDKKALLTFKRLMRQVLQVYLGNKPLHSRKLFTNHYAS